MKDDVYQSRRSKFKVLPTTTDARPACFPYGGKGISVVPGFDGFFMPNDLSSQLYEQVQQDTAPEPCPNRKPLKLLLQQEKID